MRVTPISLFSIFLLSLVQTGVSAPETSNPLRGKIPEFGYHYFEHKSLEDLIELWGSDNPGLRNTSALESARRIWKSSDPIATLKGLLPTMEAGLKSDNPNRRRAVADLVYGLHRAGGKYRVFRVLLSDEDKLAGYNAMRIELGALLPTLCKNIKEDPHLWARAGAIDMAAKIIPPYLKPEDGRFEKYAKIIRPLLLKEASNEDRFMQLAVGSTLNAIGIDGLEPTEVIKSMGYLIETQVTMSCDVAFKVIGQLDTESLDTTAQMLIDSLGSDVINRAAMTAAEILMRFRPRGTAPAIIDFVTRDRHGHGYRAQKYFPLIPTFTDEELRSALPELKRFALMEEVRGRRDMARAEGTLKNLSRLESLKPHQMIELQNAKRRLETPPHQWIMELFDRIGEERPKVGKEITGGNPEKTAKVSAPPWIPENKDQPLSLPQTDALFGQRAMDLLPLSETQPLPIDERAFTQEAPESSCGYLNLQMPHPQIHLRRPLGPTGILGSFSQRRIFVLGTQPGSPSHGVLQQQDWILGVNGRYFTKEPRIGMGYAIEESEGRKDGSMNLKVLRKGKILDVVINLPAIGRHVDSWPYNCEKSEKILEQLCEFSAQHDSKWVFPGALLLLASGEDKYLPEIRSAVYQIAKDGPVTSNWFTSYRLILLCEYYQRYGDANILPTIKIFSDHLTSGQTYFGGYLHNKSYFNEWKDASKVGYGEMNMAGAPALLSLIMANECGVEINNTAFKKSIDYFKVFSGRGSVPYGAFPPYIDGPETGGKTVLTSVAFDLLGMKDVAKPFVTMSSAAYERMWTGYHGGSFWNATWRPLSVARDSVDAFKTLTGYNLWHYNLARNWHGGITAPVRSQADFTTNHSPSQVMGFGMIYTLPRKAIRITGAPRSIFSRLNSQPMLELKKMFDARNDEALIRKIEDTKMKARMTEETLRDINDLLQAVKDRKRLEAMELKVLEQAIQSGDHYRADHMIFSMQKAGVMIPTNLLEKVKGVPEAELLKGHRFFHLMTKFNNGPASFGPKETRDLTEMAKGEGYYAKRAHEVIHAYGVPMDGQWNLGKLDEAKIVPDETVGRLFFLINPSFDAVRSIRMKSWVTDVGAPHPVDNLKDHPELKGWSTMDYDDRHWPVEIGPFLVQEKRGSERETHLLQRLQFVTKQVREIDDLYIKTRLGPRNFKGTIYLNGEAIVEFTESPCGGGRSRSQRKLGQKTTYIKLPDSSKELLKEGRNVLTVRASLPPISNWSHAWMRIVDVGLGATKVGGGTFGYEVLVKGE